MKRSKTLLGLLLIVLVGFAIGRFTAPSSPDTRTAAPSLDAATEFTCSMHPQIRQPNPGKCPICAMDLIPAGRPGRPDEGGREIALSPHARALARIVTAPVEHRIPEIEVRLFGRILPDESRVRSISARFPARIERLYVNYTGVRVHPGDHLAQIYSPEFLTAQTELLSALRFNDPRSLRSARGKLSLWGLSDQAIAAIETAGEARDTVEIDAPLGGFVIEKLVNEGDYVTTGSVMLRIADLSAVWVVFDAFEIDKPWLRFGQSVTFTAEAIPGETFAGRIAFIPPVLDTASRTFKVRANVENAHLLLRPGMFVTGTVQARVAGNRVLLDPSLEGRWISPMHPEIVKDAPGACDVCGMPLVPIEQLGYSLPNDLPPPLVVPASAVLRTGRRAVVYVEVPNREDPIYEGREITLGPRAGDLHIVASGLDAGERVVVNGAFKLDSALQLLAKPSMMSAPDPDALPDFEVTGAMQDAVGHLMAAYFPLWRALARDDLGTARDAALALSSTVRNHPTAPGTEIAQAIYAKETARLGHAAEEAGRAADLQTARQTFEQASLTLIRLVRATGIRSGPPPRLAYCPMAFGGRRADWLQDDDELLNPYFGSRMLRCGEFERLPIPPPAATNPLPIEHPAHDVHYRP
ncbi:MAG: efflux RND transporter periplasmic adaptor subunit [Verrucomicrobiae bacterium]|nr:efflux RND transporter periplasmic adaptor subunit [Verrucomicrobiae bacterium]